MNTLFLKIAAPILLLVIVAGCEKEKETGKGELEGYIVGSFTCYEIDANGQATGHQTERGYCILLENSGKLEYYSTIPMDFYTFDLPDNMFDFPEGIILPGSDGGDCGPWFFPDSLRNAYKIRFNYGVLSLKEKVEFVCGACNTMEMGFPWDNYAQVRIKDITKY